MRPSSRRTAAEQPDEIATLLSWLASAKASDVNNVLDGSCCVDLLAKRLYLAAKTLASLPPLLRVAVPRFRESALALLNLLAQPLLVFSPSGVYFTQLRLSRIQKLSDTLLGLHRVMHCPLSSLLPNCRAKARPRALLAGAERDADLLPAGAVFDSLSDEPVLQVGKRSMNLMGRHQGVKRWIRRQSLPSFGNFRRNLPHRQLIWTTLARGSMIVNPA
jgi:hypothetical protein